MGKSKHLLSLTLLVLSISVAFSSVNTYSYHKYVKTDYSISVSKIVLAGTDLSNTLIPMTATYEPFYVAFNRDYVNIIYPVAKVQNKALPLSKKLWLINCQLAFK